MTFAEMTEITNQRLCTIEFEGKQYKIDLKTQVDHKKFAGKAYELIGSGIKVNYYVVTGVDEDDNTHGYNETALAFVRVGDALHGDEFPVYACKPDYQPQQIGMAKMIERK